MQSQLRRDHKEVLLPIISPNHECHSVLLSTKVQAEQMPVRVHLAVLQECQRLSLLSRCLWLSPSISRHGPSACAGACESSCFELSRRFSSVFVSFLFLFSQTVLSPLLLASPSLSLLMTHRAWHTIPPRRLWVRLRLPPARSVQALQAPRRLSPGLPRLTCSCVYCGAAAEASFVSREGSGSLGHNEVCEFRLSGAMLGRGGQNSGLSRSGAFPVGQRPAWDKG